MLSSNLTADLLSFTLLDIPMVIVDPCHEIMITDNFLLKNNDKVFLLFNGIQ
jgi:hypothetical protein